ncbi:MAG: metallopeptidase family protein [Phycisphaeraceae bacterium]
MNQSRRDHFDAMLERVIDGLPPQLRELLDEVPLIVEDYPSREICEAFDLEYRDELCGLHDGIPLTDRSVEGGNVGVPDHIMIYREGILAMADNDPQLREQIRITVLHEIGHHFGLDEDDLEKLGYG